jgi:hypothetical protein
MLLPFAAHLVAFMVSQFAARKKAELEVTNTEMASSGIGVCRAAASGRLRPTRRTKGQSPRQPPGNPLAQRGSINVDRLPDSFPVPDVSLRLRCSACGSRKVKTQPDWKEGGWARSYGR